MLLMEVATAASVTSVLEVLGAVFTYLMSQISELATLIMGEPLLLIPIGITVAFIAVKFFKFIFSLVR